MYTPPKQTEGNQDKHLLEWFAEFLVIENGLSKTTINSYLSDLVDLMTHIPLLEVSAQSIINLLDKRELSLNSRQRRLSVYRRFYGFLLHEGVVKTDPTTNLSTGKRVELAPLALTESEIKALLQAVNEDFSYIGLRTNAILELLLSSGLRISEALSVKTSDVIYNNKITDQIAVVGKGGKERIALINHSAREAIEKYLHSRRDSIWLFPGRGKRNLTRQRFFDLCKKYAIKAGIEPARVSPHVMRHSFATQLLRNGMDIRLVQELLGHANISSTQIYTKLSQKELYEALAENNPLWTLKLNI